jgi:hypothetical protein
MDDKRKLVSRRDFLVAGGAVLAAGTLSACTPKTGTETVTNTITNTKTVTSTAAATSTGSAITSAADVTLTLYDPQGPSEVTQLFAVRSGNTDMNGKTVGFINTGWNGDATIKYLADLLKQRYPTVKLIMPEDWNVHEGEDNKNDLIQKMKDFKPDYVIISNAG